MINTEPMCDDKLLREVLLRDCDTADTDTMLQHMESCERCQRRLNELAADDTEWTRAANNLANKAVAETEAGHDELHPAFHFSRVNSQAAAWTDAMAKSLLSPASHPELLGRIGRYDVERLIGSGGMGVVFKAHDTELNRPVAVKLLAPYLASSGGARQRFAREARAAAAVVDDHVVPIHNVESGTESENEHPFLVMKYISGGSLQERLNREGPLEVCEVLRVGMQAARGLAAAHAQGLIHRDVKPSNILLDEGVDRALLTDFGLARAQDDASLTRSGFHPGTPHYMSPEQVRGEAIDARSDLFGLGCVLYALCTGHPPFRSETSYAVLRRVTDDTPRPILETNPDVPAWLEKIVMKLLAKSANDRFETAKEVGDLLENCLAHVQQPIAVPLPKAVAASASQQNRRPPIGKFLGAAAFAFSLLFAGVLIVLELNKGTLTIECEADGVPIHIMKGNEIVRRLVVDQSGEKVRIAAGDYVVIIDGPADSITVADGKVTLHRGDEEVVKIVQSTDSADASLTRQQTGVDVVLGKSQFAAMDHIEIQSVTSSGKGLEVGATVTVNGIYTLNSNDRANLCFFSTTTLKPGERPKASPVKTQQRTKAVKGTHPFTLSKVITEVGDLHVSFYHQSTGNAIGGVYFSEREEKTTDGGSIGRAWQQLEPYVAPDFKSHFPDNKDGGLGLDTLWNSVDKDSRGAAEILKTVRQGFRNTSQHRMPILRWIGNKYIWNKNPQNADAIELMYHAADFSGEDANPSGARHSAVYFGLSVTQPKTPAILRTLAELAMRVDDPSDLGRIAWGASNQKTELIEYLKPFQDSDDETIRIKAEVCRKIFNGELKAFAWAAEQAQQRAKDEYGDQLPELREVLMSGSSDERFQALQTILEKRIALIMDDSFLAAFAKCAEDTNPRVRVQTTIIAGHRWIWEAPQDQHPEAMRLMLKLSKDDDRDVRFNAVYYGLSTVREKSDEIIERLLEMAFADREPNLFHRIEWGLRNDRERVAKMLNEYIAGKDKDDARAAREVFKQLTEAEPPPLATAMAPSDPLRSIAGFVMEFRSATPDVPVCLCDAATGLPVAKDTYKPIDWSNRRGGNSTKEMAIIVSDAKGKFRFDNVPDGKYRLIAQKWMGPYKGVFELHGAQIRLLGTVEDITVPRPADAREARVVPVPLGENTIQFNQNVPNSSTILFLSTAAPEFDPILGLQGVGVSFWKNLIGVNRMPLGKTTAIGTPNKTVYAFLFAPDNSPGFATLVIPPPTSGLARVPAEPFVAGWSDGRKTPPPKLAELIEFMKKHKLSTQELLEIPQLSNANHQAYRARMQELMPDLSRTIELPDGQTTRVGDLLAVDAYRRLQK